MDIAHQRLHSHRLVGTSFEKPDEVVGWMGAVQAQDYVAAKWAVIQRTIGMSDAALDQAFAEGVILRTHVMRPTWHFVTPADIRWMLRLTAPRVNAVNAYYYRKLNLDSSVFAQSNVELVKALRGGKQLTRSELESVLQRAGIITAADERLRIAYVLMRAELDGVICSGALHGKQHTYALLDERVPPAKVLERDEALAELAKRYFTSHGPATLRDFIGWSGLLTTDARAGLEMIKTQLVEEAVDGKTYWFSPDVPTSPRVKEISPTAYLLPAFDEYVIAYKEQSTILDPQYIKQIITANGMVIVIDGRIVGTWKRIFKKDSVVITIKPFISLVKAENRAVVVAAHRYGAFLDMPVVLA